MGEESPGQHHDSNDIDMNINVYKLINPKFNEILNNLHKLSPIHFQLFEELEIELRNIYLKYDKDEMLGNEIHIILNKINESKKKRTCYSVKDKGPYTVIIEKYDQDGKGLHPMDLGKRLYNLKIENIGNIAKKGKNRIGVTFKSYIDANKVLTNINLLNEGYRSYIPQRLLTTKGIIKDVGFSVSVEDIIEDAITSAKILDARRLNRRIKLDNGSVDYQPTTTMLVTFEGKIRPEEIVVYSYNVKVHPYLPPIRQCTNCLRFGHLTKQCRSKTRCIQCGEEHPIDLCSNEMKCIFCHGQHLATDWQCKERERQKRINELMGFYEYSYYEATQLCPPIIPPPSKESFHRTPQAFPPMKNFTPSKNESINAGKIPQFKTDFNNKNFRTFSQIKKRKINMVEKQIDQNVLKEVTMPQPTRTSSPNGVALYSQVLQTNYGVSGTISVQERQNFIKRQQAQGAISKITDYQSEQMSQFQSEKINNDNISYNLRAINSNPKVIVEQTPN